MSIELVDVLEPPEFKPTGEAKPVHEAVGAGNWVGVMNLWLVRSNGSLLYQQRPDTGWQPGKFDGSVGGFYRAGESGLDGLREAREELGWNFSPDEVDLLGQHLSVGLDIYGRERRLVVTVFMAACEVPLSAFILDRTEVPALYEIAADDVINALLSPGRQFTARGINCLGQSVEKQATHHDFSYVFGGYHLKIAQIAKLYAKGERHFYF